jgi:hypothetical protein
MNTSTLPNIPTRTCTCKHCGHRWVSRKPKGDLRPGQCSRCRTWGWNTDAIFLSEKERVRIAFVVEHKVFPKWDKRKECWVKPLQVSKLP